MSRQLDPLWLFSCNELLEAAAAFAVPAAGLVVVSAVLAARVRDERKKRGVEMVRRME